ncbi:hypothetical protein XU06_17220 [Rhodococcus erythropolis]|nr:hypothetical protein XU06_17220 [Rhodococcus erythropolis]
MVAISVTSRSVAHPPLSGNWSSGSETFTSSAIDDHDATIRWVTTNARLRRNRRRIARRFNPNNVWATVLVITLCALVALAIVCSMIFDKNHWG